MHQAPEMAWQSENMHESKQERKVPDALLQHVALTQQHCALFANCLKLLLPPTEGAFSVVNAEQHLRDKWYHGICQSSATKVSFFMDNMLFDSNVTASYLRDIRPSASLFSLIKSRLGAHSLRVETDRWLRPKPPREQRVCRHCSMQAVEDEQHFLFDCPFYSIIRGQHFSLVGPNYQQRDIRLFFE